MSEDRRIEEYVSRREATNDFGRKTNDKFSGREACVRRSKVVPSNETEVTFSEQSKVVELFQDDIGIVAVGGYIRSKSKTDITCEIECDISEETFKNSRTITTTPDIWFGFGADVRIPVTNEITTEIKAKIRFDSPEEEQIEVFGIDVGCVDDGDRLRNNYEREKDGKSTKQWFEEFLNSPQANPSPVPVLYYLDHDQPFLVDPKIVDPSTWEDGGIVFLKACNRPPGRYLPSEYEPHLEGGNVNFSSKDSTRKFELSFSDSTVPLSEMPEKLKNQFTTDIDSMGVQDDSADKCVDIVTKKGKQYECRACKNHDVNFRGNPLRTTSQLREDSASSAYDELARELLDKPNPYKLWRKVYGEEFDEHIKKKFNYTCFKFDCDKTEDKSLMEIDHTLPKCYLYPLDESATLLCKRHNNSKRKEFPKEFYRKNELEELASKTGLGDKVYIDEINTEVVDELVDKIVWFFDEFLGEKFEDNKKAAVFCSRLQGQLDSDVSTYDIDLIKMYENTTGEEPPLIN